MTLQGKLSRIGNTLVTALVEGEVKYCDVYHYWRPQMSAPFCVWAEDSETSASLHTDNTKREQVVSGYVEYYTKTEYDPALDVIQDTLNDMMPDMAFTWRLNSVQYEDDTNLIHYEWTWEVA